MITRKQIVEEARTWLGTPFHHQGRLKGVGCDCPAPIIGVAKTFNFCTDFVDELDYSRIPNGKVKQLLGKHLIPVSFNDRKPGDVVCIAWAKEPQHVGILTEKDKLLHAYSSGKGGSVVETTLAGRHLANVCGVFRFPGIID